MNLFDDAFKWLAAQPLDVQLKALGIDVRIRDDAPRDAVFFVPTRKTIERAVHEGPNPDRYFGMITDIKV
jgi:hypothetical protein